MRSVKRKSSLSLLRGTTNPLSSIYTHGIGVVLRSENPEVEVGAHVYGYLGQFPSTLCLKFSYCFRFLEHKQYDVKNDLEGLQVIDNPYNLKWSSFVGVLGMPGKPIAHEKQM